MFRKSHTNFMKSFTIVLFLFVGMVNAFQSGDGSLGNPYQISTCTELQNMSSCLSCNYTLIQNIDCSATNGWNGGKGFEPIGNCTGVCWGGDDDYYFYGTLDGSSRKISNLYINRTTSDNVGLFAYINSSASIYDINLANIDILGNNSVGGLVGYSYYGVISHSSSSGIVKGVGMRVGGLVGYHRKGYLNYSYSHCDVYGTWGTGGLVGFNNGDILNSYATGQVDGNGAVGGLVGEHDQPGIINNSYATGDVNNIGSHTGGLAGYINGDIYNSYAIGNVNGDFNVGGLIGQNANSVISNSYAIGSVNGSDNVGGLVGHTSGASGEINNSFSTSSVTGITNIGGLIGGFSGGTLTNLYWNNISGNPNSSVGLGLSSGINTIQNNISWFYSCSNEPMVSWLENWFCSGSGLPQLSWQVVSNTPSSSNIFPFENNISILTSMFLLLLYLFIS